MATRNFRELVEAMPPGRRMKIEKHFQASLASMPLGELDELRSAREMTQLQLVEALGVHQSESSFYGTVVAVKGSRPAYLPTHR